MQFCTYVNNGHQRFAHIVAVHGLHQGLSSIQQGKERQLLLGLRNPVQETVLRPEDGGRLDNDLQIERGIIC